MGAQLAAAKAARQAALVVNRRALGETEEDAMEEDEDDEEDKEPEHPTRERDIKVRCSGIRGDVSSALVLGAAPAGLGTPCDPRASWGATERQAGSAERGCAAGVSSESAHRRQTFLPRQYSIVQPGALESMRPGLLG